MKYRCYSFIKNIIISFTILLTGCTVGSIETPPRVSSTPELISIPVQATSTLATVRPTSSALPTQPAATKTTPEGTETPLPSPTHIMTATAVPNITPQYLLQGPLIAYRVQGDDSYLLLFDLATLTFREVRKDFLLYAYSLEWLDNGCHLYIHGRVIDLQGNIIEEIADYTDESEHFKVYRLSPDRDFGVNDVLTGTFERESIEHRTLEILNRNDPTFKLPLAPNGGAYAFAWSPDGEWLAFSDYDENHILQVYRATPDGQAIQQLTSHSEESGVINVIAWSPDGQHIAYAASTLLPHQFEQGNEGWVGLISLADLQTARVTPDQFAYTKRLWWNQESEQIAFVGESLLPQDDPLYGSQIHWANGNSGTILKSLYSAQSPIGRFGLESPVGDLNTFFLSAKDGYYLFDATTDEYNKVLDTIETGGLIRDYAPAPFDFPGEENCQN